MPSRTSLLIRGRSPLRVPLGGLQTRCTVQQSLSLEEEEQTLCMSTQQKPCMRQLALAPRGESRLLLLAAFEKPLLRVPLGGLQTRCTVQQSLSFEEEEQTMCMFPRPLTPMKCAQDLTIRTWKNTTVVRT